MTSTPEEIEAKLSENEEKITESMKELLPVPINDLTNEEKQMLAAEELTKEEAIDLIVGRANATVGAENQSSKAAAVADSSTDSGEAAVNESDAAVANEVYTEEETDDESDDESAQGREDSSLTELAAEVYVLRAEFTNRIESLKNSAASEYKALSPEERTASKKTDIGMKYLQMASQLEAECDGQMDDIISRIKAEIALGNIDPSFAREVQSAYAQEKSLQKAYYLSQYTNK